MKNAEKICELINKAFSYPFQPKGFVSAHNVSDVYSKPTINLRIGAREVTFALDSEFMGQSTTLESKWYKWWVSQNDLYGGKSVKRDFMEWFMRRANRAKHIDLYENEKKDYSSS